jgi:hypothetical protein
VQFENDITTNCGGRATAPCAFAPMQRLQSTIARMAARFIMTQVLENQVMVDPYARLILAEFSKTNLPLIN